MMPRRRFYRAVFTAAGIYNIAWGLWSIVDPQWLFRFTGMPLANHPAVFACLGMVVGVYGLLYFDVARAPERGWSIAAVGLLGKILGPIGMAWLIVNGTWPLSAAVLCVTNDLIWWVPFAMYLRDVHRLSARSSSSPPLRSPTKARTAASRNTTGVTLG